MNLIMDSTNKTKRVTIYPNGLTIRRIFTETSFGKNSMGFEVKFDNVEQAKNESEKWITKN